MAVKSVGEKYYMHIKGRYRVNKTLVFYIESLSTLNIYLEELSGLKYQKRFTANAVEQQVLRAVYRVRSSCPAISQAFMGRLDAHMTSKGFGKINSNKAINTP